MFATMPEPFLYALLFAFPLASALPWEGPAPTPAGNDLHDLGWTPIPSAAPAALFAAYELKKRQVSTGLTTRASTITSTEIHSTCGFLTGDPKIPITCITSGAACAVDLSRSVFGCCTDPQACQIRTSCVPQSALSACDSNCVANPYIAKCNPTYAFCNQNILVSTGTTTLTNWYCDDSPTIMTQFATPTSGTLLGQYTTVTMSIPSKISSSSSSSSSSTSFSSSTIPTSVITITPTPAASATTTPAPESHKSTPIGAIVGGVVGGIAVIIAIIVGVICFGRRGKKSAVEPAPVAENMKSPGPNYGPVPAATGEPGVGGFYQPAIAEKEAPLPHGNTQQPRAEMYSPPQSPAPQYTPSYSGHQPAHQSAYQTTHNGYPNMAEMGSNEISAHAAPGSY